MHVPLHFPRMAIPNFYNHSPGCREGRMRDMTDQSHHFQSIREGIGMAAAPHLGFKFKDGSTELLLLVLWCHLLRRSSLFSQLALTTAPEVPPLSSEASQKMQRM